jgi:hypothetical protein
MSAGTGGTSATIGRYIRCQGYDTQLMVVDPQNSVFLDYWQNRDASLRSPVGSKIEGIGRPRVEPSLSLTSWMRCCACRMPPAWQRRTGWKRSWAAKSAPRRHQYVGRCSLPRMREEGRTGSIVTLLCDSGERYLETYYNPSGCRPTSAISPLEGADCAAGEIKKPDRSLACWKGLTIRGNKGVVIVQPMRQKMGHRFITAVSNNRQMGKFCFQLRHRIPHNQTATYATQHFAVVHGVAKRHTILQR